MTLKRSRSRSWGLMSDAAAGEEIPLCRLLAVAAPIRAPVGETLITRQKETVDNDVEAVSLEGALVGGV